MIFKRPELSLQFGQVHPKVKFALEALDSWLRAQRYKDLLITEVLRTPAEQEDIYWQEMQDRHNVHENIARELARKKFSWHLCLCAVDARITDATGHPRYTMQQAKEIMTIIHSGRPKPEWEILRHDVGRGDHLHVAFKDRGWQSQWSQKSLA